MTSHLLRVRNASQLVTVAKPGEGTRVLAGSAQRSVHIIENGTIIVGLDGKIVAIGAETDISFVSRFAGETFETDIDATGKCVVPGLVDAHTHPVWSGDRVHEFAAKLAGATYMDIHKMGGGIHFTVGKVRESSQAELEQLFRARLDRMLAQGTTLVEAKTGYGLDLDTELKMLRAINAVAATHPITVCPTFLSAHAVPKGKSAAEATNEIISQHIPTLKALIDSGEVKCDNIDVFCDKGIFETEDTRRILEAGVAAGLQINFHGDELHCTHSAELGAELGAHAISHLEEISDEGAAAMAKAQTVAVLLPTTAHILHLTPPPARKMIELGVPVALGSDFNPNAHCLSMPFVINLACVQLRMSMEEALVAATVNAAAALGKRGLHGSLEEGKYGDMVIVDSARWEHLAYQLVDPPIDRVIIKGVVHKGKA